MHSIIFHDADDQASVFCYNRDDLASDRVVTQVDSRRRSPQYILPFSYNFLLFARTTYRRGERIFSYINGSHGSYTETDDLAQPLEYVQCPLKLACDAPHLHKESSGKPPLGQAAKRFLDKANKVKGGPRKPPKLIPCPLSYPECTNPTHWHAFAQDGPAPFADEEYSLHVQFEEEKEQWRKDCASKFPVAVQSAWEEEERLLNDIRNMDAAAFERSLYRERAQNAPNPEWTADMALIPLSPRVFASESPSPSSSSTVADLPFTPPSSPSPILLGANLRDLFTGGIRYHQPTSSSSTPAQLSEPDGKHDSLDTPQIMPILWSPRTNNVVPSSEEASVVSSSQQEDLEFVASFLEAMEYADRHYPEPSAPVMDFDRDGCFPGEEPSPPSSEGSSPASCSRRSSSSSSGSSGYSSDDDVPEAPGLPADFPLLLDDFFDDERPTGNRRLAQENVVFHGAFWRGADALFEEIRPVDPPRDPHANVPHRDAMFNRLRRRFPNVPAAPPFNPRVMMARAIDPGTAVRSVLIYFTIDFRTSRGLWNRFSDCLKAHTPFLYAHDDFKMNETGFGTFAEDVDILSNRVTTHAWGLPWSDHWNKAPSFISKTHEDSVYLTACNFKSYAPLDIYDGLYRHLHAVTIGDQADINRQLWARDVVHYDETTKKYTVVASFAAAVKNAALKSPNAQLYLNTDAMIFDNTVHHFVQQAMLRAQRSALTQPQHLNVAFQRRAPRLASRRGGTLIGLAQ